MNENVNSVEFLQNNHAKGQRVAYVRVSSLDQNEARQVENLERFNIDKWYIEKISGKNTDREQLQAMMEYVREGDQVVITDFSRLARSTISLLELIDFFDKKKVTLISLKENLDSSSPVGRLLITMIAAVNEFERRNLLERQAEGIAIAKREGKYKGHKKKTIDEDIFAECLNQYRDHKLTKTEFANKIEVSRRTLYRIFEERGIS